MGAIAVGLPLQLAVTPHAKAQLTEQEFQMGRAREACTRKARQQLLTVNRIVSTTPISGSGGHMIGSDVLMLVSRSGSTYNQLCRYDNTSRTATFSSQPVPPIGKPPGSVVSPPIQGEFHGRGLARGSVFGLERQIDASLSFNRANFSLKLYVPPGKGAQVHYGGTITHLRGTSASNPNSFVVEARVTSFASSANSLRTINTSGSCQMEIRDARIISVFCKTPVGNSTTNFTGLKQF